MIKQQQQKQQQQQEQVYVEENVSNLTSPPISGEASVSSSSNRGEPSSSIYPLHHHQYFHQPPPQESSDQPPAKKKRNQPGNPDPDSEVIALSPKTLLAKNRFVCEICNKGFQRDQNLQLHRRGHNLPWKLKQRSKTEVIRKKVYVCPEPSCVHHDPSRALGDLTGIKKHFCRKHGEKKWKCEKCSKKYAVQSDWKAHSKVCGTREYRCDCGTLFSRRDSFITHRAFCDALAEETARAITTPHPLLANTMPSNSSHFMNMQQQQHQQQQQQLQLQQQQQQVVQLMNNQQQQENHNNSLHAFPLKREQHQPNFMSLPPWLSCSPLDHLTSSTSSQPPVFHHHNDDQIRLHHHHQSQTQNPSLNPSMGSGPTFNSPTPHMSATALLQQAAQMGATTSNPTTTTTTATTTSTAGLFGLNLSSRDHQQHDIMSSLGNKPTTTTTTGHFPGPGPSPGPTTASSFLHDMMVNTMSTSYEDAFGIGSSSSSSLAFQQALGGGRSGGDDGGGKGSEGMTRDFLGLRPLSQSDMLTIAELSNCMATNSSTTQQQQQQEDGGHKSWQN
ncbi:hypothetical protein vseg_004111 [Gypsophila vaccaria]